MNSCRNKAAGQVRDSVVRKLAFETRVPRAEALQLLQLLEAMCFVLGAASTRTGDAEAATCAP